MTTAAATWLQTRDQADIAFVLWIDGLGIGFTNHRDVTGLRAAWSAATSAQFDTGLRGGLEIQGSIERSIELFKSKVDPGSLTFSFLDYENVLTPMMFGEARPGIGRTRLSTTCDADAVTITVDDPTVLPALGYVYVGLETMLAATGMGPSDFDVTRGLWSIFPKASTATWFRYHQVTLDGSARPAVTTQPVNWLNRSVGLYVCHRVGSTWSAGFPGTVANDAELLWAGRLKHWSEDGTGWISLDCVEITELVKTTIGARMYEGTLVEGTVVAAPEADIQIHIRRTVVVGPGSVDFYTFEYGATMSGISGQRVTHPQAAEAVNIAFTDAFVTHSGTYAPAGFGMSLSLGADPNNGDPRYLVTALFSGYDATELWAIDVILSPRLWRLFGFAADQLGRNRGNVEQPLRLNDRTDLPGWVSLAGGPPKKTVIRHLTAAGRDEILVTPTSELPFTPQSSMPEDFSTSVDSDVQDGFLIFDEQRIAAVGQLADDQFILGRELLSGVAVGVNVTGEFDDFLSADDLDDRPIKVRQVWGEPSDIGTAILRMLISSGTYGYNVPLYDTLPLGLGVGFPSSIVDIASFLAMPPVPYLLLVPKPEPFVERLQSALDVVGAQLVWKDSALTVVMPIGGSYTPVVLDETNKAVAFKQGDAGTPKAERTTCDRNPVSIINRTTLKHNYTTDGKFLRTLTVNEVYSQSDFDQTRSVVVEALGIYDEGADYWAENVAAATIAYFARPLGSFSRSIDVSLATKLFPGAQCSVDDDTMINPQTGERGVTGLTAWAVSVGFNWLTGVGSVNAVFAPEATTDPSLGADMAIIGGDLEADSMSNTLEFFDSFIEAVFEKKHDLSSDTLKLMLCDTPPDTSADVAVGDVTEIAAGFGYSSGGAAVTVVSSSQTDGRYMLVLDDVDFTASGGDIGPFRYLVLANTTATGFELIGCWDRGVEKTIADGETWTAGFDATSGAVRARAG